MKHLVILISMTFFGYQLTFAQQQKQSAEKTSVKKSKQADDHDILTIIAKDYIKSLTTQQEVLQHVLASKNYSARVKKEAQQVLPILSATIKELKPYTSTEMTVTVKDYKEVGKSLIDKGHNAMIDANDVIVVIIDGGDGGDDGDGDGDKPDCSGAYTNIQSACARGVSIKMSCGFYGSNGGAAAVEQALEKCSMDANAAVASCESGSNTNTFGQESAYETNAMMVCSSFEEGGLEPNAAQTQTPTGN